MISGLCSSTSIRTLDQRWDSDSTLRRFEPVYRARVDEVNKFLRETLPQWNEKLRALECANIDDAQAVESRRKECSDQRILICVSASCCG